jgi:hypothetical protein
MIPAYTTELTIEQYEGSPVLMVISLAYLKQAKLI